MSHDEPLIEVLKPGLATSVQDRGRQGYYHLGIPPSGALDQYALAAANLLVGNPEDAAVLECTLMGPELRFTRAAVIAVTGAAMTPKIDGQAQACNTALAVPAGARLSFDFVQAGARACLAIAGGIDVPEVLGSRSTYTLGAIGGFEGRRLQAGDRLRVGAPRPGTRVGRALPAALAGECPKEQVLRVVPGLYDHRLMPESAASFYEDAWSVTSEADRIGYRYKKGRALKFRPREQPFGAGADPSNIVDACYPIGSIQVPAGGRAHHPAPRRRVRRRLRHDRHRDQRRPRQGRPDAAQPAGALRAGHAGDGLAGPQGLPRPPRAAARRPGLIRAALSP